MSLPKVSLAARPTFSRCDRSSWIDWIKVNFTIFSKSLLETDLKYICSNKEYISYWINMYELVLPLGNSSNNRVLYFTQRDIYGLLHVVVCLCEVSSLLLIEVFNKFRSLEKMH